MGAIEIGHGETGKSFLLIGLVIGAVLSLLLIVGLLLFLPRRSKSKSPYSGIGHDAEMEMKEGNTGEQDKDVSDGFVAAYQNVESDAFCLDPEEGLPFL
jgi:hypothetical protein